MEIAAGGARGAGVKLISEDPVTMSPGTLFTVNTIDPVGSSKVAMSNSSLFGSRAGVPGPAIKLATGVP